MFSANMVRPDLAFAGSVKSGQADRATLTLKVSNYKFDSEVKTNRPF